MKKYLIFIVLISLIQYGSYLYGADFTQELNNIENDISRTIEEYQVETGIPKYKEYEKGYYTYEAEVPEEKNIKYSITIGMDKERSDSNEEDYYTGDVTLSRETATYTYTAGEITYQYTKGKLDLQIKEDFHIGEDYNENNIDASGSYTLTDKDTLEYEFKHIYKDTKGALSEYSSSGTYLSEGSVGDDDYSELTGNLKYQRRLNNYMIFSIYSQLLNHNSNTATSDYPNYNQEEFGVSTDFFYKKLSGSIGLNKTSQKTKVYDDQNYHDDKYSLSLSYNFDKTANVSFYHEVSDYIYNLADLEDSYKSYSSTLNLEKQFNSWLKVTFEGSESKMHYYQPNEYNTSYDSLTLKPGVEFTLFKYWKLSLSHSNERAKNIDENPSDTTDKTLQDYQNQIIGIGISFEKTKTNFSLSYEFGKKDYINGESDGYGNSKTLNIEGELSYKFDIGITPSISYSYSKESYLNSSYKSYDTADKTISASIKYEF